jgi:sugar diacid utilization regulator
MPPPAWPGGDSAREQLSALRSLLVLSMLLTRQQDEAGIVHLVANAVESIGQCRAERIMIDGRWAEVRLPQHEPSGPALADLLPARGGMRFELTGVPWSWAYSMSMAGGPASYLVVGADREPAESDRFLLEVLAQQAGVALANTRLHARQREQNAREREQAERLQLINTALQRTVEIHDRLTQVALKGEGQDGIARAVYELTSRPAAIEDRFGNLRAWAGPGRPDHYPKDAPKHRASLLRRAAAAGGPITDGKRMFSLALLGGTPVGALVLHHLPGPVPEADRLAVEHATTVLTAELARLQTLAATQTRLRSDLVIELIDGAEGSRAFNHAQALGYDLGRPHRVVLIEGRQDRQDMGALAQAVRRAAANAKVGSLQAARLHDVVVLADQEAPWDRFREALAAELRGADFRIGVGSRSTTPDGLPRSYRDAQLALRMQKAVGVREHVTVFDDLGVYQVLATVQNSASMEHYVTEWLGNLLDYDAAHGSQLVVTLTEYLECGGSHSATATVLSVHPSTVKYRLRRIREVSGYDLSLPDTRFNLQLAARAWRITRALGGS